MKSLRDGRLPVVLMSPGRLAAAMLAAALAGGCSSNPHKQSGWAMGSDVPTQQRIASESTRRYDVEDDGMEAQVAPPPSIRMAPDDPSEPFSPNYGSKPAGEPATQPAVAPARPAAPSQAKPGRSKFASAD